MSETDRSFEVVIPAYNAGTTLAQSIESALAASAKRVIVVDDGSRDATASIAQSAGAHVIRQENAGAAVARRTGLYEVETPYVVMLDSDDALISEGVERSVAGLEEDSRAVACGGAALGFFRSGETATVTANTAKVSTKQLLAQGFSPIPPACIVWRTAELRHALLEASPEPLLPRYAEDYEMIIRASMRGIIHFHRELSARYAMEGGKSIVDPSNSIRSVAQIRAYYARELDITVPKWTERSVRARVELRRYKNANSRGKQVNHLLRSFVNSPGLFTDMVKARLRRG